MSINETLLKIVNCCFTKDEHILLDPVLVPECQSSACKQCILDSKEEYIYCYGCNNEHEKTKLLNATTNKVVEDSIQSSLDDLFEHVDDKLKDSFESLSSK